MPLYWYEGVTWPGDSFNGWMTFAGVVALAYLGYFVWEMWANSNWQIVSCNSNGSYSLGNGITIWPHDMYDNPIYELRP